MSTPLLFDKKATDQVGKDFSKVKLTPEQSASIAGFAKLWAKYVPLNELVLRGFILLSLKDLQEKTHVQLAEIGKKNPEERKKLIGMLEDLMFEKLSRTLIKPGQKDQLRTAVKESMDVAMRGG